MFAEERCKVYFVVGKIVRDGIQRNSARVAVLNVENTFSDKICGTNSAANGGGSPDALLAMFATIFCQIFSLWASKQIVKGDRIPLFHFRRDDRIGNP